MRGVVGVEGDHGMIMVPQIQNPQRGMRFKSFPFGSGASQRASQYQSLVPWIR